MIKNLFTVLAAGMLLPGLAQKTAGPVVSTLMYYLGQEMYTYNLVTVDVSSSDFKIIQELLPSGIKASRNFESFTAYDESSRTISVAAVDFPSVSSCTLWQSVISGDATTTTPVVVAKEIKFPVSRSPAPLNVAHLKFSRLIVGPSSTLFAVFTNGEVHEINLEEGTFSFKYALVSDELQLGVTHPYLTAGHVYDRDADTMWSIAMGASDAFLMSSSLKSGNVSSWTTMAMPQGDNSGFSPETVTNMHLVKVDSGPAKVMVLMESLHNVGFDQVSFLDTTTGQLDCKECNLMSEGIEFMCQDDINACDLWRVSAWDPVNKQLYFQGHGATEDDAGTPLMVVMGFDTAVNGALTWWTNVINPLQFGLSGFQFVQTV